MFFPAYEVDSQLEEELCSEGWNGGWYPGLVFSLHDSHELLSLTDLVECNAEGLLNSLVSDLLKKKGACLQNVQATGLERVFIITNDQNNIYIKKQLDNRNETCTQSSWFLKNTGNNQLKLLQISRENITLDIEDLCK